MEGRWQRGTSQIGQRPEAGSGQRAEEGERTGSPEGEGSSRAGKVQTTAGAVWPVQRTPQETRNRRSRGRAKQGKERWPTPWRLTCARSCERSANLPRALAQALLHSARALLEAASSLPRQPEVNTPQSNATAGWWARTPLRSALERRRPHREARRTMIVTSGSWRALRLQLTRLGDGVPWLPDPALAFALPCSVPLLVLSCARPHPGSAMALRLQFQP